MNRRTFCAILPAVGVLRPANAATSGPLREKLRFDNDWKFLQGDPAGAQAPDFDAAAWRALDLPHDWSIEGRIDAKNEMGGSGGYFPAGVGWYRRNFTVPPEWAGKRVVVEFEGVYMNAAVYINGHDLGMHPYGYTTFLHDLTPHLKPGANNVLAVRVDQSKQRNSRWYAGSGIYRHVWLHATDAVHVAPWGTQITTPEVSADHAKVIVNTRVANESGKDVFLALETVIYAASGAVAGRASSKAAGAGRAVAASHEITIEKPALWNTDTPHLYRAVTRVMQGDNLLDEVSTTFGVRSVEWSVERGFVLNGSPVKMCGGCIHHDQGPLGAAAFDRAEERRIQLLKESGFNAIRTSHNPPSPALLDACDRLGMLVMDEAFDCWSKRKNPFDYNVAFEDWWQRDIDAMVLRDRNHPSVVMWSIGNEVPERGEALGAQEAKMLADYLRSLDRTRPVTSALNLIQGKWSDTDGFFSALDVAGYNYNLDKHTEDHQRVPSRIMACTESYPQAMFDYWAMVEDTPYIIGDFVWTAIDYLGESGLGRWYYRNPGDTAPEPYGAPFPYHGADCGDIDLCGNRRSMAHYRNIVWNRGEKLFLGVRQSPPPGKELRVTRWGAWPVYESWNWPGMEGKPLDVEVYSRGEAVRLFLDDKLIGEKPTTRAEKFKANFSVPYAPGVLKAVAVQSGKTIAQSVLKTAGEPAQLRLTADRKSLRADGQGLAYITVEVVDAHGQAHPNADLAVTFSLRGPGTIAGVGNADLTSEEPYQGTQRKLFHGKALAIVRSSRKPGALTLTASAPGVKSASLQLSAQS